MTNPWQCLGGVRVDNDITFAQAIEAWLVDYAPTVSVQTLYRRTDDIRVHISPDLGGYRVSEITPQILRDYIASKLEHGSPIRHPQGLRPATIKNHFRVIRSVLNWAVDNGIIDNSPADKIRLPKINPPEIQVFGPDEVERLIKAARPKWMGDAILLAYRTGMRRGEIFGLQWADIDFEGKYLAIRRMAGAYTPKNMYVKTPKTRGSTRRVDLDEASLKMLAKRRKKSKSEWVFASQYGTLLNPWGVVKYMHDACVNANVPHRSFHILRHTHATMLLAHGVNPKIVQERLGHSNISMTLDTYAHMIPTLQHSAIQVLNNL